MYVNVYIFILGASKITNHIHSYFPKKRQKFKWKIYDFVFLAEAKNF